MLSEELLKGIRLNFEDLSLSGVFYRGDRKAFRLAPIAPILRISVHAVEKPAPLHA